MRKRACLVYRSRSLPGTTIACGDSHTSTHGAFGAIAFGIGTTQIRDVLATQTIALNGCLPNPYPFAADGTFIVGPWAPS